MKPFFTYVALSIITLATLIAGCGHSQDFDPYVIIREAEPEPTEPSQPTGGFETEVRIPSIYAKDAVEGTAWELLTGGAAIIEAMDFVTVMSEFGVPVTPRSRPLAIMMTTCRARNISPSNARSRWAAP